jgi:hypothetical protein
VIGLIQRNQIYNALYKQRVGRFRQWKDFPNS